MIDVALLGIIRRWHLRDHVSLREIARRLGISRNTVRRYLRAETIEPAYADRRAPSSLDKYALKLSAWLKTETTKSRKQRRTLKQMHIELCALGFEGSYDRVAAFARQWKMDRLARVNLASKGTIERIKANEAYTNEQYSAVVNTSFGIIYFRSVRRQFRKAFAESVAHAFSKLGIAYGEAIPPELSAEFTEHMMEKLGPVLAHMHANGIPIAEAVRIDDVD